MASALPGFQAQNNLPALAGNSLGDEPGYFLRQAFFRLVAIFRPEADPLNPINRHPNTNAARRAAHNPKCRVPQQNCGASYRRFQLSHGE